MKLKTYFIRSYWWFVWRFLPRYALRKFAMAERNWRFQLGEDEMENF